MMDSNYLEECAKGGPWWAETIVEALEALRIGNIDSAVESLESLLPEEDEEYDTDEEYETD